MREGKISETETKKVMHRLKVNTQQTYYFHE